MEPFVPETFAGARMREDYCFAHLSDESLDEQVSLEQASEQPRAGRKLAAAKVTKPLTKIV